MTGSSKTQIFAQVMLTFILAGFIFGYVMEPSKTILIITILYSIFYILLFLQMIQNIKRYEGHPVEHEKNYTLVLIFYLEIAFLGTCTYLLINNVNDMKNSVKTISTIYDIDKKVEYETEYEDDGNSYEKRVEKCTYKITYEVEGDTYSNEIEGPNCNKDIEDTITIYYDKEDPTEITQNNILYIVLGLFISGVAFIFTVIGTIRELIHPKKKKNKNKIKTKKKKSTK